MVKNFFQLNLSHHAKKLEMRYLEDNNLFSVPFSYNMNSCQWEIDNLTRVLISQNYVTLF